jgi:hypothetical protein
MMRSSRAAIGLGVTATMVVRSSELVKGIGPRRLPPSTGGLRLCCYRAASAMWLGDGRRGYNVGVSRLRRRPAELEVLTGARSDYQAPPAMTTRSGVILGFANGLAFLIATGQSD